MNTGSISLRLLTPDDSELHKELIYVALWDHPDEPRRPRSVLDSPVVKAYYEDWGQKGDFGMLALVDDQPAGFIQLRMKHCITDQYADLPELAIAVFPQYHRQGIAGQLFEKLLDHAQPRFKGIRLGVNPRNEAAISLYEKFGFSVYAQPEGAYPQMVMMF